MRKAFVGMLLLLLLPGLAGAAERPARAVTATVDADGVQRMEITGGGYYFDPFQVTVKVNTPVELKVRKEGGMVPHDFMIHAPEAGIDFDESLSSEPKTIKFTPTKTGRYPFYCSKRLLFMESHREKGMEGFIEVVE